jgi:hypothetical protein
MVDVHRGLVPALMTLDRERPNAICAGYEAGQATADSPGKM